MEDDGIEIPDDLDIRVGIQTPGTARARCAVAIAFPNRAAQMGTASASCSSAPSTECTALSIRSRTSAKDLNYSGS